MAKPPRIKLDSDNQKKFSAEVFDLIRTKLAPKVGGNVNLGVKLAAEYFAVQEILIDGEKKEKPRMPATVTAVEMGDAIPKIAEQFAESAKKKSLANDDGRLPLTNGFDANVLNKHSKPDNAQAMWDLGRWKGLITIRGLTAKYAVEIAAGGKLTEELVDGYAAELKAEKAKLNEGLENAKELRRVLESLLNT